MAVRQDIQIHVFKTTIPLPTVTYFNELVYANLALLLAFIIYKITPVSCSKTSAITEMHK